MPDLHIHLLSNIALFGLVYFFDKSFKKNKKSLFYLFLTIIGSNLIDLDHLLSNPVYDSNRCSINFHPLHSWYFLPIWFYGLLQKNKYFRYFCLGVLVYLGLDLIYCF